MIISCLFFVVHIAVDSSVKSLGSSNIGQDAVKMLKTIQSRLKPNVGMEDSLFIDDFTAVNVQKNRRSPHNFPWEPSTCLGFPLMSYLNPFKPSKMSFPPCFGRFPLPGALCFGHAWHWQDSLSAACGLVFAKDITVPCWITPYAPWCWNIYPLVI